MFADMSPYFAEDGHSAVKIVKLIVKKFVVFDLYCIFLKS